MSNVNHVINIRKQNGDSISYFIIPGFEFCRVGKSRPDLTPETGNRHPLYTSPDGGTVELGSIDALSSGVVDEYVQDGTLVRLTSSAIDGEFTSAVSSLGGTFVSITAGAAEGIDFSMILPPIAVNRTETDFSFKTSSGNLRCDSVIFGYEMNVTRRITVTDKSQVTEHIVRARYIDLFSSTVTEPGYPADNETVKQILTRNTIDYCANSLLMDGVSGARIFAALVKNALVSVQNPHSVLMEHFGRSATQVGETMREEFGYDETTCVKKLIGLGCGAQEKAGALDLLFNYGKDRIFAELSAGGIPDRDILTAIRSAYGSNDAELADLMLGRGYEWNVIADMLHNTFLYTPGDVVGLFKTRNVPDSTIITILLTDLKFRPIAVHAIITEILSLDNNGIASILSRDLKFTPDDIYGYFADISLTPSDISSVMHSVTGISNTDVTGTLKKRGIPVRDIISISTSVLKLTLDEISAVLHAIGVNPTEIALLYAKEYSYAEESLLILLDALSTSVDDFSLILQLVYNYNDRQITTKLLGRDKLLSAICGSLYTVLEYPLANVLSILKDANTSTADIAHALYVELHLTPSFIIEFLKKDGVSIMDIANILRDTLGLTIDQIASSLRDNGYSWTEVVRLIGVYLEYPQEAVLATLQKMGVPVSEVAELLKNVLNFTGEEMAAELYKTGTGADKIADILYTLYFFPAKRTATLLFSLNISSPEIGQALKTVYEVTAENCFAIFKELNMPIGNIAKCLNTVYGISPKNIAVLFNTNGIKYTDIVPVLFTDLACKEIEFIACLAAVAVPLKEIVILVIQKYRDTLDQLIENMYGAGVSVLDISLLFAKYWDNVLDKYYPDVNRDGKPDYGHPGFNYIQRYLVKKFYLLAVPVTDIVTAVKTAYKAGPDIVVYMLAEAGVSPDIIVRSVKDLYACIAPFMAVYLKNSGFGVDIVMGSLFRIYAVPVNDMVLMLKNLMYEKSDDNAAKISSTLYLFYNCESDVLAKLLKSLMIGETQIAKALKTIYGCAYADTGKILLAIKSDISMIVAALKDTYPLLGDQIIVFLNDNGVAVKKIAAGVFANGFMNARDITYCFRIINVPVSDMYKILTEQFLCDPVTAVKNLRGGGYTAELIAGLLATRYKYKANKTAETLKKAEATVSELNFALKTVYKLTDKQITAIALQAGYTIYDIARYFMESNQADPGGLVPILAETGFSCDDIANCIHKLFEGYDNLLVKVLRSSGFRVNEIAKAIKKYYGLDAAAMVIALDENGIPMRDIAGIMIFEYKLPPLEMAKIMNNMGKIKTEIVDILKNIYRCPDRDINKILKQLGIS